MTTLIIWVNLQPELTGGRVAWETDMPLESLKEIIWCWRTFPKNTPVTFLGAGMDGWRMESNYDHVVRLVDRSHGAETRTVVFVDGKRYMEFSYENGIRTVERLCR